MINLYQFTFSHYCEKARWALDYKAIPYRPINLLPGFHRRTALKIAPKSSLPIIVDEGMVIQDSAAIIDYLDERYPQRLLTPKNRLDKQEALNWEAYCDKQIGVPLRIWFYYHLLPDTDRSLKFILAGIPWPKRQLFKLSFAKIRPRMQELMQIDEANAQAAEARFRAALDKLDKALLTHRFLVGDDFSRADLTACALLSPMCMPGKTDSEIAEVLPQTVKALIDRHKDRPYFRWVKHIYADYRQTPSKDES